MSFCAICTSEAPDLERSEDGFLECGRCREEHPNYRGYSFGDLKERSGMVNSDGNRHKRFGAGG